MTDLRARAEALLTAFDFYSRADREPATARSPREAGARAKIMRDGPAIIRDLLAALPPDPAPTGERRPCDKWQRRSVSGGPWFYEIAVTGCRLTVLEKDRSWKVSNHKVRASGDGETIEAAQLAAEDAAAELLRAGLRALGLAK